MEEEFEGAKQREVTIGKFFFWLPSRFLPLAPPLSCPLPPSLEPPPPSLALLPPSPHLTYPSNGGRRLLYAISLPCAPSRHTAPPRPAMYALWQRRTTRALCPLATVDNARPTPSRRFEHCHVPHNRFACRRCTLSVATAQDARLTSIALCCAPPHALNPRLALFVPRPAVCTPHPTFFVRHRVVSHPCRTVPRCALSSDCRAVLAPRGAVCTLHPAVWMPSRAAFVPSRPAPPPLHALWGCLTPRHAILLPAARPIDRTRALATAPLAHVPVSHASSRPCMPLRALADPRAASTHPYAPQQCHFVAQGPAPASHTLALLPRAAVRLVHPLTAVACPFAAVAPLHSRHRPALPSPSHARLRATTTFLDGAVSRRRVAAPYLSPPSWALAPLPQHALTSPSRAPTGSSHAPAVSFQGCTPATTPCAPTTMPCAPTTSPRALVRPPDALATTSGALATPWRPSGAPSDDASRSCDAAPPPSAAVPCACVAVSHVCMPARPPRPLSLSHCRRALPPPSRTCTPPLRSRTMSGRGCIMALRAATPFLVPPAHPHATPPQPYHTPTSPSCARHGLARFPTALLQPRAAATRTHVTVTHAHAIVACPSAAPSSISDAAAHPSNAAARPSDTVSHGVGAVASPAAPYPHHAAPPLYSQLLFCLFCGLWAILHPAPLLSRHVTPCRTARRVLNNPLCPLCAT
ncbi:hypothetical protein DENSPDRAFT_886473 [Dentipellis sp. KUC8613]|nr:hypothetical protein DENSPDRAFT_886473 [Dentipellis sp. KUC8613]